MIPPFLLKKENIQFNGLTKNKKLSFIDKTIKNAATFISETFIQWQTAKKTGFLQNIDGRVKVIFLLLFVILVSITTSITSQITITAILLLLCIFSKIHILHLYKRVLTFGFIFGFLIFLPASLNIFSKGEYIFTIMKFSHQRHFWIYTIPKEIAFTNEGIQMVTRLTLKVMNSITTILLVSYTTTFERIIKSLSFFKIPDIFILTLTLTYKFIFILSNTIIETYFAIKMRWWNNGTGSEAEEIIAGRVGYLFRKSKERYETVYQSMVARGFNGKFNFCYFNKFKTADFLYLSFFLILFIMLLLIN